MRVTVPLVDVMTSRARRDRRARGAATCARQTGEGQRIDVSLLDALVHAQASGLGAYFLERARSRRAPATAASTSRRRASTPAATARASSSPVRPTSSSRNLCRALEVDWTADPRFATIAARLANQDELDGVLAARCRDFARDELLQRLIAADVLAAPINEIPEVAADPQVRHNEMIVATEHATLGRLEVTGVPIKLRGTPGSVRRARRCTASTRVEILGELGYGAAEIAALSRSRVIGSRVLGPHRGGPLYDGCAAGVIPRKARNRSEYRIRYRIGLSMSRTPAPRPALHGEAMQTMDGWQGASRVRHRRGVRNRPRALEGDDRARRDGMDDRRQRGRCRERGESARAERDAGPRSTCATPTRSAG